MKGMMGTREAEGGGNFEARGEGPRRMIWCLRPLLILFELESDGDPKSITSLNTPNKMPCVKSSPRTHPPPPPSSPTVTLTRTECRDGDVMQYCVRVTRVFAYRIWGVMVFVVTV